MEPRLDFITLATPDLDAARTFYVTGLGWTPTLDVPGEVIFFQIGHGTMLGLYDAAAFLADLGAGQGSPVSSSGTVLSHNVDSRSAVDRLVEEAVRAGATVLKPPQQAGFGGYHAHVADPNGVIWEVAHNPGWRVDDDGTVRLDAVDPSS
jgi:catechol 2,3-dioxygenase-like lactoylglutathione lyase family enzyme